MMTNIPHLTKSKYISGLQCHRKLWLECHQPTKFLPSEPGSAIDIGNKIGRHALEIFPGGVEVTSKAFEHQKAVDHTKELMANQDVTAIFEAAFELDQIRTRVDILERLPRNKWGIREVKSSQSVKSYHIDDVAIQYHVLAGCGLKVTSVEVVHVNNEFILGNNKKIDWNCFFLREEVLDTVKLKQNEVKKNLNIQKRILTHTSAPSVDPYRKQCSTPFMCDNWADCTQKKPEDWVQNLYRINSHTVQELKNDGIEAIRDLPKKFKLSSIQKIQSRVITTNKEFISEELGDALSDFGFPAFYLDFEYIQPLIPKFSGSRVGERLPFQWSIHRVESALELSKLKMKEEPKFHREYLANGADDFREECAEKLLEVLGGKKDTIIVYFAGAEKGAIESLADSVPKLSKDLAVLIPRLRDLLVVVRSHTCLPNFFSKDRPSGTSTYSIKNVVTPLAPDFSYGDLDGLSGGMEAAAAFYRIMEQEYQEGESEETLRKELLMYCRFDTLAMVKVHQALLQMTKGKKAAEN